MMEPTRATTISTPSRMPMGRHWLLINLKYSFTFPPSMLTTPPVTVAALPPSRWKPEVMKAQTMYTTQSRPTKK